MIKELRKLIIEDGILNGPVFVLNLLLLLIVIMLNCRYLII